METNLRRVVIVMLLCMVLMLSACSTNTAQSTDTTATTEKEQSETSETETEAPTPEPLETVTLKIYAFASNPDGSGLMENAFAKLIENDLAVLMDLAPTNEQDTIQQLPAMIASNDLPDIFYIPETDTLKYIEMMTAGGQILALDDYIGEYAPNLTADPSAQASIELKKMTLSPDGKLYTIGMARGTFDSGNQPVVGQFMRWDLYKRLGYPELNDYEEDLLDVLAQMQELEPTNSQGEKVYAVGGWFGDSQGWGDWHITYNLAYAEGYNCLTPGNRIIYSDNVTNKIVETNAQKDKESLYWRQVRWFNKAYQMGILDPDSFTQKYDQYESKALTGRYLFINPGWMIENANKYFEDEGTPEKGFTCLPPIGTDQFTLYRYFISGQYNYGISSGSDYPERALMLLDWLSSYENSRIMYDGVEGKYWTMEDGKPVPTDEYLALDRSDADFQKETGQNIFGHFIGYAYGTVDPATGVAVDLYSSSAKALEKKLKPVHQDMLDHYGADSLPEMYMSLAPGGYKDMTLFNLGSLPTELQTQDSALQSYEFKNIFRCLLAESDEEFEALQDEYIEGLDAFDIDAIYDYYISVGKQQEEDLAPIFDELGN